MYPKRFVFFNAHAISDNQYPKVCKTQPIYEEAKARYGPYKQEQEGDAHINTTHILTHIFIFHRDGFSNYGSVKIISGCQED